MRFNKKTKYKGSKFAWLPVWASVIEPGDNGWVTRLVWLERVYWIYYRAPYQSEPTRRYFAGEIWFDANSPSNWTLEALR